MVIIAHVLKEKWFENDGFCSFTNNNQLVNEVANDSARVRRQHRKIPPLSEPIRLQDLEDSARSQAWKKINLRYLFILYLKVVKYVGKVKNKPGKSGFEVVELERSRDWH